ncbi:MAG: recombination mediator RecR [Verrucomicrobia bacterium]|nr:recombination mediator RecR [Verrucomicrobiota bacterium]
MADYPPAALRLVAALRKLPGVGPRSAERLALHLLSAPPGASEDLAHAVREARSQIIPCPECGFFSEDGLCEICRDRSRDDSLLCVVEHAPDVLSFERSASFRGRYHVLGGLLSPLDGIGPDELRIPSLLQRAKKNQTKEVILGFGTDARGETTAIYLAKELSALGLKITRLATGVAAGSGLEFVDSITLGHALSHRREL